MDEASSRADRRGLLRSGLAALLDLAVKTMGAYLAGYREAFPPPPRAARTRVRPPGALPEAEFRRRCTSCRQCATACPYDALREDDARLPYLWDPAGHPCYMCDGYPCIAACGPGALTFLDRRLRTIGLAVIAGERCLAHQGEECTACRDACRDFRAIRLVDRLPVVDAGSCTGCAVCVGKCPAAPAAIEVVPASS
ncbi:MAG: 4Fe-4S binding protein [Candidatus Sericytochromatia bacterium]|nr:4Fe-4S binding protein [Candidatus Tanganyikabacteria bacterium]